MNLKDYKLVCHKQAKLHESIALEVFNGFRNIPMMTKYLEFFFCSHIKISDSHRIYVRATVMDGSNNERTVWAIEVVDKLPESFSKYVNTFIKEYLYNEQPVFNYEK